MTLHVAAQLGLRHVDLTSARFLRAADSRWTNSVVWAGANAEVAAPSELIQQVKTGTRDVLARQVTAAGADGCLLTSLEVTVRAKECSGWPARPATSSVSASRSARPSPEPPARRRAAAPR